MADKSPEPAADPNLHRHMARAVGVKDSITDSRRQLVHKARQQLDTLSPVIKEWETAVQAGRGGGHLAARRLRTTLDERARLEKVIARHGHLIPPDNEEGGTGTPA